MEDYYKGLTFLCSSPTLNRTKGLHTQPMYKNVQKSSKKKSIVENLMGTNTTVKPKKDVVMSSYASNITYGKEVKVNGVKTCITYNYDKSSMRCVVGLSVSDKLTFLKEQDSEALLSDAKEFIQMYVNKMYMEFLKTKTYDADDCCLCLDPNPDAVIYQCGHKCLHMEFTLNFFFQFIFLKSILKHN